MLLCHGAVVVEKSSKPLIVLLSGISTSTLETLRVHVRRGLTYNTLTDKGAGGNKKIPRRRIPTVGIVPKVP